MFTGLVETKGTLVRRTDQGRFTVEGKLGKLELGESIAVDGVCLTVDKITGDTFEVDVSTETLEKTTLGSVPLGAPVNLERALAVGDRLGGHIVSGHVDGVGAVVEIAPMGNGVKVTFEAPSDLARFIATKGSITVSGVSLTVNHVNGSRFDVMLIPHTREKTSFSELRAGSKVNLEVDVLARYVARLLEASSGNEPSPDSRLLDRLRASGYV